MKKLFILIITTLLFYGCFNKPFYGDDLINEIATTLNSKIDTIHYVYHLEGENIGELEGVIYEIELNKRFKTRSNLNEQLYDYLIARLSRYEDFEINTFDVYLVGNFIYKERKVSYYNLFDDNNITFYFYVK